MLTPLDIQNAVFHRSFRGYNETEVDEFLDRVVVEYEQLLRENLALKEQVAAAQQVAAAAQQAPATQPAPAERHPAVGPSPAEEEPLSRSTERQAERERLAAELEGLRQAVREEGMRLEALRQQRRLFATQFQAMLESYRTMLMADEGRSGAGDGGPELP
ncbi:MAG TPA: DivIVA domain-containing protein [Firmicutes bacterium]|nr:DivIVA domain-containing protein [Bacillota bacterium]